MDVIIVADENELKNLNINVVREKKVGPFVFKTIKINGTKVVICHSGISIANAAACTQLAINLFKPNKIINFGAVGALKPCKLFDVIAPEKIFYHDVHTPWYDLGQVPGEPPFFTNKNDLKIDGQYNIASGSSFLTDVKQIKNISKKLDVYIFDMEVAAIAQIAHKNNVDLNVVKVVSDVIGFENTELKNINENIKNAGQKAFEIIKKLF